MSSRRLVESALFAVSLLSLAAPATAQNRQFEVKNDGGSRIQFVSDAPLETITGVSTNLGGQFGFDPAHPEQTRGRVFVVVNSIRTGIDLRDEHVRSDHWLDGTRFPNATFEILSVQGTHGAIAPGQAADLSVHGRFTIHGHSKDLDATVRVRYLPLTPEMRAQGGGMDTDALRVHAQFTVRLTDYGISVPDVIRLKVSDDIVVNVDLRAVVHAATPAAPPAPPPAPPAPPPHVTAAPSKSGFAD